MKKLIKEIHGFVKNNCEYYNFAVEWDLENEMLGLKIFKVDDDFSDDYKQQADVIKQQVEKEFGIEIWNYCEPSSYEVECLDVRRQKYMDLSDLLFDCNNWLDYSVEVDSEWDGVFSEDLPDYDFW